MYLHNLFSIYNPIHFAMTCTRRKCFFVDSYSIVQNTFLYHIHLFMPQHRAATFIKRKVGLKFAERAVWTLTTMASRGVERQSSKHTLCSNSSEFVKHKVVASFIRACMSNCGTFRLNGCTDDVVPACPYIPSPRQNQCCLNRPYAGCEYSELLNFLVARLLFLEVVGNNKLTLCNFVKELFVANIFASVLRRRLNFAILCSRARCTRTHSSCTTVNNSTWFTERRFGQ